MNKKYKFIVFDFDGVVCDSTDECMVTAWNAWEKFNNRSRFRLGLENFNKTELISFRSLRPYVRGASEYYVLMRSIESKINISNQNDFDYLKNKWEHDFDNFKKIFFEQRESLRKKNINYWIDLHIIFDDVIKKMKKLSNEKRLLIATLKDKKSVILILKKYGLSIGENDILDQSEITTKLEALNHFVSEKEISKEDLCFIDDNITHLIQPHQNNYKVFLSNWGNTLNEHKEKAIKNNIKVLESINDEIL
tara:strand:+ start:434 stop:1183 length:750 start_codon:yes stop_codon:yes gene_type:complete